MTATLRVVDQTTEGADWVLTVGFYAPVGFATARVTQEVGGGAYRWGVFAEGERWVGGVFVFGGVAGGVVGGAVGDDGDG